MSRVDGLILCIALLGAVLGVLNTWYFYKSNRVRIRVVPKLAFDMSSGRYITSECDDQSRQLQANGAQQRWAIEVINLSAFPLTIDEVGFSDHTVMGNYAMVQPELSRGKTWPVRLKPREKVVYYSTDGTLLPGRVLANPCAYAKTDCGYCFYGESLILSKLAFSMSLEVNQLGTGPAE